MLPKAFPRGLVLPVMLILAAELALRGDEGRSNTLAPPSRIVRAGAEALLSGELVAATMQTFLCAAAGLFIGFSIGLASGVVLGLFSWPDRALRMTIEVLRPIPSVALIPIAILIFSFGYRMEIAIVAFATIWPALILCRAAVHQVPKGLGEVAVMLNLSFAKKVFSIILPAIVPRILVAFRISIGISLVVAVTVEITSNPIGLGNGMFDASRTLNPGLNLAYLAWIGLWGWLINMGAERLEAQIAKGFGQGQRR